MRGKMTRRSLDKKTVKISCSESPDEQEDFIYSWDLNLSSDEDIFLKGKSEILWSRTRDLFDSPDSFQSFSDFTGRTFSSCSWHNDEFDMKSSSKVNASLEAIDNALYEKVNSPFLSNTVFEECCDWSEKFPYFRIKGTKITLPEKDNYIPYSVNGNNIKHFDLENSTSSLHLEGKKVPIHSASKSKGMPNYNVNENKVPTDIDEIVDNEGEHEEYFALHKSDQPIDCLQVPINESSKAQTTFKLLQEKVLDKLVSDMWPTVLAFLENLDHKQINSISDDLQLPPITVVNEQKRILGLKRPKTEGSSIVTTEFPKLESILTVSPKVLQKREFGCISRVTRPSSEMSVNLRMPSKTMKSAYSHSSNIQIISESSVVKNSKGDSENLCLVLPALEEDFQDSSSVLRGFHIEPGRKDSSNKIVQSPRNDYTSSTSRENAYFLPPIEDKNYVPSNVKLTKNLFTFYGSPVRQDKSKYTGSARYKKTNSRPNTSVSKKSIKSNEVTQQLPVNSGLYITAKGVNKIPSTVYTEKTTEVSFAGNETVQESQEKSVTLFPIVTSLTPHEEKNSSVKKGLLHSFLGGKKR